MKELSIKQRNNLKVGNSLGTEIHASADELRCFIVIGAYKILENHGAIAVSKILNSNENILYFIRKYEVNKEYIENNWDVHETDLINSIRKKDISSLEELQIELLKYIDDLSVLDVTWKFDNPIA
ncbi:hypothetical protein [Clostridium manihotivorum]|uniref:Uncharacterized protein n=1 Tax=Clostridium manihotivorum TaxID=2320868 RepID=A0A410DPW5_9CLOT|nr:hypothetical protein [Clostridium manihotivorum]QAA31085.1 hypothetical protein C1I91_05080 [Clostridium manihotivorum]